MATTTKETKEKIQFLQGNFTEQDYKDYIDGIVEYKGLCEKFNCSDYLMCTIFKPNGLHKRRALRKNNNNEDIFDKIESSVSAYIFGFDVVDGCATKDSNFQININEQDLEILTKIRDYLSPITKLNH